MTRPTASRPHALAQIRTLVGPGGWIDDPTEMAPHLSERRGLWQGRAAAVVKPGSTEEVAGVLRLCHGARIAVVPQGGNTGLVGGGVPDDSGEQIVVSLARMNRIRSVDALDATLVAEAGCVLAHVQEAARAADLLFPLSLAAEGSCQIGGNLSTNAGGVHVLRWGSARSLVLGLEVVLADGRVWDGLRALRKDNTGTDLKQLFLGSEGTLGIITAAVLRLVPLPHEVQVALVAVRDPRAAVELLARVRSASGDLVSAFELISRAGLDLVVRHVPGCTDPLPNRPEWSVLIELSAGDARAAPRETLTAVLAAAHDDGLVGDGVFADGAARTAALWKLRESFSEAQRAEGVSIKHDISVPVSRIADFLERAGEVVRAHAPDVRVVAFGHVGDGNLHYNLMQPAGADPAAFVRRWGELSHRVHDVVVALGGSISAEHGIGQLKRDELRERRSEVELDLMRRVKRALDPEGILNPGKLL